MAVEILRRFYSHVLNNCPLARCTEMSLGLCFHADQPWQYKGWIWGMISPPAVFLHNSNAAAKQVSKSRAALVNISIFLDSALKCLTFTEAFGYWLQSKLIIALGSD